VFNHDSACGGGSDSAAVSRYTSYTLQGNKKPCVVQVQLYVRLYSLTTVSRPHRLSRSIQFLLLTGFRSFPSQI
jgi:hypothetical protein